MRIVSCATLHLARWPHCARVSSRATHTQLRCGWRSDWTMRARRCARTSCTWTRQVRLSASRAVRAYMARTDLNVHELVQLLAPAMCLNRYSTLDSLHVYSQVCSFQTNHTTCAAKLASTVVRLWRPAGRRHCRRPIGQLCRLLHSQV